MTDDSRKIANWVRYYYDINDPISIIPDSVQVESSNLADILNCLKEDSNKMDQIISECYKIKCDQFYTFNRLISNLNQSDCCMLNHDNENDYITYEAMLC